MADLIVNNFVIPVILITIENNIVTIATSVKTVFNVE